MELGSRDYYIKLDNILPANADCVGYKCISATSGPTLLERARVWFHIRADSSQLQLWSAGTFLHSVRVDHLAEVANQQRHGLYALHFLFFELETCGCNKCWGWSTSCARRSSRFKF